MSQHPLDPSFPPVPEVPPRPEPPAHPVTPPMVMALKQTRPWVMFLSILGFIGAGFMVLGGVALAVVMGFAGSFAGSGGGGLPTGMGRAMGMGLGALYLVLGLLYLFPSLYLYRYASGIAAMLRQDPVGGMESALRAQKAFWKFVGICMIALLCAYAVLILCVVVFAGLAAVRTLPGL